MGDERTSGTSLCLMQHHHPSPAVSSVAVMSGTVRRSVRMRFTTYATVETIHGALRPPRRHARSGSSDTSGRLTPADEIANDSGRGGGGSKELGGQYLRRRRLCRLFRIVAVSTHANPFPRRQRQPLLLHLQRLRAQRHLVPALVIPPAPSVLVASCGHTSMALWTTTSFGACNGRSSRAAFHSHLCCYKVGVTSSMIQRRLSNPTVLSRPTLSSPSSKLARQS